MQSRRPIFTTDPAVVSNLVALQELAVPQDLAVGCGVEVVIAWAVITELEVEK